MDVLTLLIVLQAPQKPSMMQVRERAIAIERKLDQRIAEKAHADARAKAAEYAIIRRNEKKIAENRKRISLLETKIRRIALAKSKTVTLVRYLPVRTVREIRTVARKPMPRAQVAVHGMPPKKTERRLSFFERIFAWPGRSGRMASMKNSWD